MTGKKKRMSRAARGSMAAGLGQTGNREMRVYADKGTRQKEDSRRIQTAGFSRSGNLKNNRKEQQPRPGNSYSGSWKTWIN